MNKGDNVMGWICSKCNCLMNEYPVGGGYLGRGCIAKVCTNKKCEFYGVMIMVLKEDFK